MLRRSTIITCAILACVATSGDAYRLDAAEMVDGNADVGGARASMSSDVNVTGEKYCCCKQSECREGAESDAVYNEFLKVCCKFKSEPCGSSWSGYNKDYGEETCTGTTTTTTHTTTTRTTTETTFLDWPELKGEAKEALDGALEKLGRDTQEPLKDAWPWLPELNLELNAAKMAMEEHLQELRDEEKRLGLADGKTPSAKLRELMKSYKCIFDHQWSPLRTISSCDAPSKWSHDAVRAIQQNEFDMTADDLAEELLKDWHEHKDRNGMKRDALDEKVKTVSNMLQYSKVEQRLSHTAHHWNHLTNIFILTTASLRDVVDPRRITWNLGAVGVVGGSLCNAAAREASVTFHVGAAAKAVGIMEFGVRWLLEKHQKVVRGLFFEMPSNKAYAADKVLKRELSRVEKTILRKWTKEFKSSLDKYVSTVALNIQQLNIQRNLWNSSLTTLAASLSPEPTNCSTLYDELVDSSLNELMIFVGTQMSYMLYRHNTPIVMNNAFDTEMYQHLVGTKADDLLLNTFSTSLRWGGRLSAQIKKKEAAISDIEKASADFMRVVNQHSSEWLFAPHAKAV